MPFIAVTFVVAALASLGLPGLSGFVAEFLVFAGSYPVWRVPTILAVFAIVVTAGYMLWLLERVFFGPERAQWSGLGDANRLEIATVGALVLVIVVIGVFPSLLAGVIVPGVSAIASRYVF